MALRITVRNEGRKLGQTLEGVLVDFSDILYISCFGAEKGRSPRQVQGPADGGGGC